LLGWAEELQTLRKQNQEAEKRLTEVQNKYRAAKKTACWYKLWARKGTTPTARMGTHWGWFPERFTGSAS